MAAVKGVREILVDAALCKTCGICVRICPRKVFDDSADGPPIVARIEDCNACRSCELHCPDFAIRIVGAKDGAGALEEVA